MARTNRTPRNRKPAKLTPATAYAMAKSSARKALDRLVKQGVALQSASRKAAFDAGNAAKDAAITRVEEARSKTVETVTQLEKMFEQRVSRAISKLGVPTTKDVRALSRQVAQLQASVDRLNRSRSRAAA
jgi:poly(hydroxyalkanoate) granule-associated protein